jgi:hypothetical protein
MDAPFSALFVAGQSRAVSAGGVAAASRELQPLPSPKDVRISVFATNGKFLLQVHAW